MCRVLLMLTMGWSLLQQRLQASQVLAFAPLSDSLNHKLYAEASQCPAFASALQPPLLAELRAASGPKLSRGLCDTGTLMLMHCCSAAVIAVGC